MLYPLLTPKQPVVLTTATVSVASVNVRAKDRGVEVIAASRRDFVGLFVLVVIRATFHGFR